VQPPPLLVVEVELDDAVVVVVLLLVVVPLLLAVLAPPVPEVVPELVVVPASAGASWHCPVAGPPAAPASLSTQTCPFSQFWAVMQVMSR
jgi:hypothetical protein